MSEQDRDRVEAHAPVDRLGSQGVAQLMGGDVADAGGVGSVPQGFGDAVVADRPVVFEQKAIRAQSGGPVVGDPVVEQLLELWVQRDVAVVVQFADRNSQPVGGADLHDRVDGEAEQFAAADAGAGEQFDDQAGQRIRVSAGGAQQLGRGGVVEEARQRFVDDRKVAGEHQRPHRRVRVAPFGDPGEEAVQVDQRVLDADPVERFAGGRPGMGAQPRLERFDVLAVQVGAAVPPRGGCRPARCRTGAGRCSMCLTVLGRRLTVTCST